MYKYENLQIRKFANALLNEWQIEFESAFFKEFSICRLDSYDEKNIPDSFLIHPFPQIIFTETNSCLLCLDYSARSLT
jgi:hypothetical protein